MFTYGEYVWDSLIVKPIYGKTSQTKRSNGLSQHIIETFCNIVDVEVMEVTEAMGGLKISGTKKPQWKLSSQRWTPGIFHDLCWISKEIFAFSTTNNRIFPFM